ncbi:hypothetical protein CPC08DRAFT_216233 [Agrocybe pediades]|nr:hypothetical protein CPC08DRAFT_216233 [Agrocybe pediades]
MLSSPPLGSSWLRSALACAFSLFVRPPPPRALLHTAAAAAVSAAAAPSPPWQSPPVACRPWRLAFIIAPSSFIAFVGYSAAFVVHSACAVAFLLVIDVIVAVVGDDSRPPP